MAAAHAMSGYTATVNRNVSVSARNENRVSGKSILGAVKNFFVDPFFWDLYEAERDGDASSMNALYEKYAN